MGDINQLAFVREHIELFQPPFLEVGSRDYGTTQDFRPLFPGAEYVGVDMEAGPGVDVVLDLAAPFEVLDRTLSGKRFRTVFCLCVLEHCRNPFLMCQNIAGLLEPGGVVYVSVPFAWKFHGYPSDYWRFTPQAIRLLFPDLVFDEKYRWISTSKVGDLRAIDSDLGRITLSVSENLKQRRYGRALTAGLLKVLRKLRIASWITGYRYLYPPVLINMLGRKT